MILIENLAEMVKVLGVEHAKFERGNKSAGVRARKLLREIKKTCQDIRSSLQVVKKEDEPST